MTRTELAHSLHTLVDQWFVSSIPEELGAAYMLIRITVHRSPPDEPIVLVVGTEPTREQADEQ